MTLLILIILATLFYTLFEVFTSRAGNKIDANLSSIIFNGLGAIIPLGIYIFLKFVKGTQFITVTVSGIVYSIFAGVAVALFSILLIKIFERGGLTYAVPFIYGGSIVLASIIGWLLFKESVSGLQAAGILIIVIGIALVAIAKL